MSISRARPTAAATASTTVSVELLAGFERPRVAHLGVLERDQRLAAARARARAPRARRRRAHPRSPRLRRPQRLRQHRAALALVGIEVRVATRHRDAVGLPHERAAAHVDRQVEIARHLPDHRELLEVLATEERVARPDDREQLRDDRRDPVEVHRAARAAQPVGEPIDVHARERRAVGVHLLDRRHEEHVDASRPRATVGVALEVARVRREILVRTELGRVHEDRHDDEVRGGAGGPHERPVPFVEEAHRRHEADGAAAHRAPARSARAAPRSSRS